MQLVYRNFDDGITLLGVFFRDSGNIPTLGDQDLVTINLQTIDPEGGLAYRYTQLIMDAPLVGNIIISARQPYLSMAVLQRVRENSLPVCQPHTPCWGSVHAAALAVWTSDMTRRGF